MSLKYGILGFLSKWEATGYDLKKEFDDFMSIFWHSHLSQIYPELGRLEQEGCIASRTLPQSGKPDKKMYSITEKGQQELMNWLLSPPETPKLKDSFLMQVSFMDNLPFEEVIFQLKAYQKEREQRLAKMKRILHERWDSIRERNVMKARILMSSAVLKKGLEQEVQYIRWCKETIELVESCPALWSDEADAAAEALEIRFSEVEPAFLRYFGELLED
ncbi:PadR family transcriptional regulator [Paenibacillus chibensis]|uniref:PadR family transcriptional regulator n=1 Tax=Paenibacillus chibensis TaxID=59846 RepID=UPI000FDC1060|nr:PadR family transcriptional regulator [Paenibacillus chibensis]MEC0371334.1 PadR family transcriptional regulator [Paenibacillus chibensis]